MLLKAIILGKNENRYQIRIPSFETAGSTTHFTCWATLSYICGNEESLLIDDVVFIGFENNNIDKPVILGKLYTGNDVKPRTAGNFYSLSVENDVELPTNIRIGDLTYIDLLDSKVANEGFETRITALENKKDEGAQIVTKNIVASDANLFAIFDTFLRGYYKENRNIYNVFLERNSSGTQSDDNTSSYSLIGTESEQHYSKTVGFTFNALPSSADLSNISISMTADSGPDCYVTGTVTGATLEDQRLSLTIRYDADPGQIPATNKVSCTITYPGEIKACYINGSNVKTNLAANKTIMVMCFQQ